MNAPYIRVSREAQINGGASAPKSKAQVPAERLPDNRRAMRASAASASRP